MNYWLHRISHHAELSRPLLDKGYLSIGFSDFSSKEFLSQALQGNRSYFDQQFQDYWGYVPQMRQNLWTFFQFQKGDSVLIPGKGNFTVCEIIDDTPLLIQELKVDLLKTWDGKPVDSDSTYLYSNQGVRFDLGFVRKVKILHHDISRGKFADSALTARMKIRQTNSCISDLKLSIEKAIKNYVANKPIHFHSILHEKTARLVLESLATHLNLSKFEKVISIYFKTIGATQVTIPAKNTRGKEGNADIIAVFEKMKLIIYVQAKFQTGQINQWAVNQVLDYVSQQDRLDDGYSRIAWVITTADSFNSEAQKTAAINQIQLIDGLEFSKMLLNAGLDLLRDFE
ncbi:MAG: restriction endonuclease [Algoriphagus sp.]|uniref:restriction endonuclease n=1 Tax=Algoriphagus sp. TaxID=1872435 RepID=UPI00261CC261|nr:restriction endonuclease [Algoriphagus sp.]MDG1275682.1 restriction endonuclease [Algoriphagus sp.]